MKRTYLTAVAALVASASFSLPTAHAGVAEQSSELVEDVTEALYAHLQTTMPKWTADDLKAAQVKFGEPEVTMELVPVPGGTLKTPDGREIKVDPFWIGKYEVRFKEYEQFREHYQIGKLGDEIGKLRTKKKIVYDAWSKPSAMSYVTDKMGEITDKTPMVLVTQHNAIKYTKWISALTGQYFRLPTEAEWVFAARAGGDQVLPEKIDEYGVFYDTSNMESVSEVGSRKPNAWGLYDVLGNAAEWVLDGWSDTPFGEGESTWVAAETTFPTVAVGGSWYDDRPEGPLWPRMASKPEWQDTDPQIPKSKFYLSDAPYAGFRVIRPMTLPELEEVKKMWISGWERQQLAEEKESAE